MNFKHDLTKAIKEHMRKKSTQAQLRKNWDRKDWWIDADECKKLGLVDNIKAMMPEHISSPKKKKKSTKKTTKRK